MSSKKDPAFDDLGLDDDDLWKDLDMEAPDIKGDFPSNPNKGDKDRNPISGTLKSVRDTMMHAGSELLPGAASSITRRVARDFPGVNSLADDIARKSGELIQIKNEIMNEINPTLNQSRTQLQKLMRIGSERFPGLSIFKKLDQLLEPKDTQSNYSKLKEEDIQAQREQTISNELTNMFSVQAQERALERKQAQAERLLDKKERTANQAVSSTLLSDIRTQTMFNTAFLRTSTTAYMKKSIELQYKHLFVARDTLEALKLTTGSMEIRLDAIAKNTALPDARKLQMAERLEGNWKERLINGVSDWSSNALSQFGKNFAKRLAKPALESLTGILDSFLTMAEMNKAAMEFGEADQLSATSIIGSQGGGLVGKLLGKRAYNKVAGIIPDTLRDALNGMGKNLITEIMLMINNARNGEYYDSPFAGIIEPLARLFPKLRTGFGVYTNKGFTERDKPGVITNKFIKTVEEVIPGYLAMQTGFLERLATGNNKAELRLYDWTSSQFLTQSKYNQKYEDFIFGDKSNRINILNNMSSMMHKTIPATANAEYYNQITEKDLVKEYQAIQPEILQAAMNLGQYAKTIRVNIDEIAKVAKFGILTGPFNRIFFKDIANPLYFARKLLHLLIDPQGHERKNMIMAITNMASYYADQLSRFRRNADSVMDVDSFKSFSNILQSSGSGKFEFNEKLARQKFQDINNTKNVVNTKYNDKFIWFDSDKEGLEKAGDVLKNLKKAAVNLGITRENIKNKSIDALRYVYTKAGGSKETFDHFVSEASNLYNAASQKIRTAIDTVTNMIKKPVALLLAWLYGLMHKNDTLSPVADLIFNKDGTLREDSICAKDLQLFLAKEGIKKLFDKVLNDDNLLWYSLRQVLLQFGPWRDLILSHFKKQDNNQKDKLAKKKIEIQINRYKRLTEDTVVLANGTTIEKNGTGVYKVNTLKELKELLNLRPDLRIGKDIDISNISKQTKVVNKYQGEERQKLLKIASTKTNKFSQTGNVTPYLLETIVGHRLDRLIILSGGDKSMTGPETSIEEVEAARKKLEEKEIIETSVDKATAEANVFKLLKKKYGAAWVHRYQSNIEKNIDLRDRASQIISELQKKLKTGSVNTDQPEEEKKKVLIQQLGSILEQIMNKKAGNEGISDDKSKSENDTHHKDKKYAAGGTIDDKEGTKKPSRFTDAQVEEFKKKLHDKKISTNAYTGTVLFVDNAAVGKHDGTAIVPYDHIADIMHSKDAGTYNGATLVANGNAVVGEHGEETVVPHNRTNDAIRAYMEAKAYHEGKAYASGGTIDDKKGTKKQSQFTDSQVEEFKDKLNAEKNLVTNDFKTSLKTLHDKLFKHEDFIDAIYDIRDLTMILASKAANNTIEDVTAYLTQTRKHRGYGIFTLAGIASRTFGISQRAARTGLSVLTYPHRVAYHALFNVVDDVYVQPEDGSKPSSKDRLFTASMFRAGLYFDTAGEDRVRSVVDITRPVYDKSGTPIVTMDDIKRGLVYKSGESIYSSGSSVGRAINRVARKGIDAGIHAGKTAIDWILSPSTTISTYAKKAAGFAWSAAKAPYTFMKNTLFAWTDVYRKDRCTVNDKPLVSANEWRTYVFVTADGKKVTNCWNITKPVYFADVEENGARRTELAISAEDIAVGLCRLGGKPLAPFGMIGGAISSGLNKAKNAIVSASLRFGGLAGKVFALGTSLVSKAIPVLTKKKEQYIDVYEHNHGPNDSPLLRGDKIKEGAYVYAEDGSRVKSAYGIKGRVLLAENGNECISEQQVADGLEDIKGNSLSAWAGRSILGKIGTFGFAAAHWGFKKLRKGLHIAGKFISGGLKGLLEENLLSWNDVKTRMSDMFESLKGISPIGAKDLDEIIGRRMDKMLIIMEHQDALLTTVYKGTPVVYGDKDHDNIRDGSYEDKIKKKAEKQKQKNEEAAAKAAALAGTVAAAADKSKSSTSTTEKKEEDSDSDSFLGGLIGSLGGDAISSVLSKTKLGKAFGRVKNAVLHPSRTLGRATGTVLSTAGHAAGTAVGKAAGALGTIAARTGIKTGAKTAISFMLKHALSLGLKFVPVLGQIALIASIGGAVWDTGKWFAQKFGLVDSDLANDFKTVRRKLYGLNEDQEDLADEMEEETIKIVARKRGPMTDDELHDWFEKTDLVDKTTWNLKATSDDQDASKTDRFDYFKFWYLRRFSKCVEIAYSVLCLALKKTPGEDVIKFSDIDDIPGGDEAHMLVAREIVARIKQMVLTAPIKEMNNVAVHELVPTEKGYQNIMQKRESNAAMNDGSGLTAIKYDSVKKVYYFLFKGTRYEDEDKEKLQMQWMEKRQTEKDTNVLKFDKSAKEKVNERYDAIKKKRSLTYEEENARQKELKAAEEKDTEASKKELEALRQKSSTSAIAKTALAEREGKLLKAGFFKTLFNAAVYYTNPIGLMVRLNEDTLEKHKSDFYGVPLLRIGDWEDEAFKYITGRRDPLSDKELEDFAYVTGFYYTTGLTDNKTVLAEKSLRIEYFNIWYNQRFLPVLKMIATAIITIFKKTSEDDIDPDEIDEIDDDNIRSEVISELVSNISEFLKNTSIKSKPQIDMKLIDVTPDNLKLYIDKKNKAKTQKTEESKIKAILQSQTTSTTGTIATGNTTVNKTRQNVNETKELNKDMGLQAIQSAVSSMIVDDKGILQSSVYNNFKALKFSLSNLQNASKSKYNDTEVLPDPIDFRKEIYGAKEITAGDIEACERLVLQKLNNNEEMNESFILGCANQLGFITFFGKLFSSSDKNDRKQQFFIIWFSKRFVPMVKLFQDAVRRITSKSDSEPIYDFSALSMSDNEFRRQLYNSISATAQQYLHSTPAGESIIAVPMRMDEIELSDKSMNDYNDKKNAIAVSKQNKENPYAPTDIVSDKDAGIYYYYFHGKKYTFTSKETAEAMHQIHIRYGNLEQQSKVGFTSESDKKEHVYTEMDVAKAQQYTDQLENQIRERKEKEKARRMNGFTARVGIANAGTSYSSSNTNIAAAPVPNGSDTSFRAEQKLMTAASNINGGGSSSINGITVPSNAASMSGMNASTSQAGMTSSKIDSSALGSIEGVDKDKLAAQYMNTSLARGVRDNNPMSVNVSQWTKKQPGYFDGDRMPGVNGPATPGRGTTGMARFKAPEYGIAAAVKLIKDVYGSQGVNTIKKITYKYSPPSENNTNELIAAYSKASGFNPDEPVNFNNQEAVYRFMKEMIRRECGYNYPEEVLRRGFVMGYNGGNLPDSTSSTGTAVSDVATGNTSSGGFGSEAQGGMVGAVSLSGSNMSGTMSGMTDNIASGPVDMSAINIKGSADFNDVNPIVKQRFSAMATEFKQRFGQNVKVNSGKRSLAQQAALYHSKGRGLAAAPNPLAPHISGLAIDADGGQMTKADNSGLLAKYGLWRPLKNGLGHTKAEAWHIEPVGSRDPNSGMRITNATLAKFTNGSQVNFNAGVSNSTNDPAITDTSAMGKDAPSISQQGAMQSQSQTGTSSTVGAPGGGPKMNYQSGATPVSGGSYSTGSASASAGISGGGNSLDGGAGTSASSTQAVSSGMNNGGMSNVSTTIPSAGMGPIVNTATPSQTGNVNGTIDNSAQLEELKIIGSILTNIRDDMKSYFGNTEKNTNTDSGISTNTTKVSANTSIEQIPINSETLRTALTQALMSIVQQTGIGQSESNDSKSGYRSTPITQPVNMSKQNPVFM